MSGLSGADLWLDWILLILIWESNSQDKHSYASSLHAKKESASHVAMQPLESQATKQFCAGHTQHLTEIALASYTSRSIPLIHNSIALFSCLDYHALFWVALY